MNKVNAKTIKDISPNIADKVGVSKEDVESVFSFLYQVKLKEEIEKMGNLRVSIKEFGTFSLTYKRALFLKMRYAGFIRKYDEHRTREDFISTEHKQKYYNKCKENLKVLEIVLEKLHQETQAMKKKRNERYGNE